MADLKSTKKVVQLDNASSSSSNSSSTQSTLTDKSCDIEFPKPPPEDYSSPFLVEDPTTYDPTRIPSSIFSGRQSTCGDWSINSNESLFSIRMGNNSFSRDHAFIVYKSGELLRLDEVFSHPTLPPLAEADSFGLKDLSERATGGALAPNKLGVSAVNNKTTTVLGEEERADKKKKKKVQKPDDVSSYAPSDGSDNSSFAFPILIGSNKAELIAELPSSSHRVSTSTLKKSIAAESQPRNGLKITPKPSSSSGLMSSWLSCSCCPFRRK